VITRSAQVWWFVPAFVLLACTEDIASPPPPANAGSSGSGGSATAGSGGSSGSGGGSGSAGVSGSGGMAASGGAGGSAGSGGSSGTTDGGAGSAGSGAAGSGGAAGPCGAAGLLVCDTFESTQVNAPADSAKWSAVGDPGIAPKVVDTKKRSGTRSLYFASTNNRGVFVAAAMGLPRPDKRFYARAYVNFTQPMSQLGGHVAFIVAASQPENGVEVRLGASKTFGGAQQAMLDLNFIGSGPEHTQFSNGDYTGGNGSSRPGIVFDADRWYCVETLFDGTAHELRVWVDEVEVPGLRVTDWGVQRTNWSPEYNVIKFGAQNYSGSLGALHYDDLAVGTGPIGCD
jgi:hypothetical protein